MLERLLKYWPIIAATALAIVSVFNIGYFAIIGLHFIGVMDLSNRGSSGCDYGTIRISPNSSD